MTPVKVLNLLLAKPGKLGVNISLLSLLVVCDHPDEGENGQKQGGRRRSQIEPVTNVVVGTIRGKKRPGRNQPPHITEHDVSADGGGSGGVGDDVSRDLGVGKSSECEGTTGDQEGGSVSDFGACTGQEHNIAAHHEWRADDEENVAAVEFPAKEGEEDGKESADHVGGNCMQLLRDHAVERIDRLNDCRGEEGETLDGDVVKEEYERGQKGNRVQNTAEDFGSIELIQNVRGSNTLRLDTGNSKIFLLLSQPLCSSGPVG